MPYNDFGSAINLSAKMNDVFSAKIIKNKKKNVKNAVIYYLVFFYVNCFYFQSAFF